MSGVENYRLTQARKRGLRIAPLVLRPKPAPFVDESLFGLIARTAARNGITRISRVFRIADVSLQSNGALPRTFNSQALERLSFVLKVDRSDIEHRLQAPYADTGIRKLELVNFFGAEIPAHFRERVVRRISPRALRLSAHHRAIHELRIFSFCPQTLEVLLDTCPVCQRRLGWRKTYGVQFCEHCIKDGEPTVDLRDHPQAIVEVDDVDALRAIPALVNPDHQAREQFMKGLHPDLAELEPGHAFELAIGLARAIVTPGDRYRRSVRGLRGGFGAMTPALLTRVGRVLLDWPNGFHRLAEDMRTGTNNRVRKSGLIKELGGLAMLSAKGTIPEPARALVARRIQDDLDRTTEQMLEVRLRPAHRRGMNVLTSREAAARLRACQSVLPKLASVPGVQLARRTGSHAATFYAADVIDRLAAERRNAFYGPACARQLGIPLQGLEELANADYIKRIEGPVLNTLRDGSHFSRKSVDRLVKKLLAAGGAVPDSNLFRFDLAIRRLPHGPRSWVDICRNILDGSLPIVVADHQIEGETLLQRLSVPLDALLRTVMQTRVGAAGQAGRPLSYSEAALYMAVHKPMISQLVRAGLVRTKHDRERRVEVGELDRFAETYVLTTEAARLLRTNIPRVRSKLAGYGVLPVAAIDQGSRFVYLRADIVRSCGGRSRAASSRVSKPRP